MQNINDLETLISDQDEAGWKELYLQHARRDREDLLPFPADEIQVITNNKKGSATAEGAISILDCILSCVQEVKPVNRDMRVLDYGCGWGRMTRLLPYYFKADRIVGVDVDERLISSANQLLPFIEHEQIASMQPLRFDDGSFDIVFANSVFSHLSERSCLFTLAQLSRVLKIGGVLVISVLEQPQMDIFYSNPEQHEWIKKVLGEQDKAVSTLADKGFIWGDTKRWEDYGIAVMNDSWLSSSLAMNRIELRGSRRRVNRGSHNYKVGIRV